MSKLQVTSSQVKEIHELRISVLGDKKTLMLATGENRYIVPTPEALDFIKSSSRSSTVKAFAFVIKSFSQRLFIKTGISLKDTKNPIAFFLSDQNAIEWLLSLEP